MSRISQQIQRLRTSLEARGIPDQTVYESNTTHICQRVLSAYGSRRKHIRLALS